jgi:hypothetical protein
MSILKENPHEKRLSCSQHHNFDVALATKYGVKAAIVIHHLQFLIKQNIQTKINFHEGRTWICQSRTELLEHLEYLSEKGLRTVFNKLEKEGIIKKGKFSKPPFNPTIWYAFVDESEFVDISAYSKNFP